MTRFVYHKTRFENGAQARLVFPVLMNTADPSLKETVLIQGSQKRTYQKEELIRIAGSSEKAGQLMEKLRDSDAFILRGSFREHGDFSFRAQCTEPPVFTVEAESRATADDLIHDLYEAASSLFPDAFAREEELSLTINYVKESMTAGAVYVLNHDSSEKEFRESKLYSYMIEDGTKPHIYTIGVPFLYAERDWVMRIAFNEDGSLSAVSLRLIVGRPDGTAVYEGLSEEEMSQAFDETIAILNRESGFNDGSRRRAEGLVFYGYGSHNVMAVRDNTDRCVNLDMLFTVKKN